MTRKATVLFNFALQDRRCQHYIARSRSTLAKHKPIDPDKALRLLTRNARDAASGYRTLHSLPRDTFGDTDLQQCASMLYARYICKPE